MTLSELILRGKDKILGAGLECADPTQHMKQIVQLALDWDATQIYLRWDDLLTADQLLRIEAVLRRRLTGEPFQYVVAHEWFWNSKFKVGPGVLIPRRETELIVEAMLRREDRETVRIAELGGGSGNIGISVLQERPGWEWHAFELNPETIPFLEWNVRELLPFDAHYHIHEGDFFALAPGLAPFDWVVANPPYVPAEDWPSLSKEVRHEPRLALDGGPKGLDCLDKLVPAAHRLLSTDGRFLCEIDSRQAVVLEERLAEGGFDDVDILKDWAGLDRVAYGRKA